MASTLPQGDVRNQLNDLHARPAKARIRANPIDAADFLPLVRQAMSETGLSQKAMAITAGIPESVLSDALNGRRNFAAVWLWAQDDHFLGRFLALVSGARQLTPENLSTVRRQRIVELVDLLLTECA